MIYTKFDKRTMLWSGSDIPPVLNPNISIAHALLRSMKLHGSKIAQINDDTGEQLSFEDLRIKTVRAAQNLLNRGYKPKQVFGFMARDSANLAPLVLASFCIGCPINPLHCNVHILAEKKDILHMFKMVEPSVIFCDIEVYDLVGECLNELGIRGHVFTFNGSKSDSEPIENLFSETGKEPDFEPHSVNGINDTAVILCSSGTTGPFKGICVSHALLLSVNCNMDIIQTEDTLFTTSALSWGIGVLTFLWSTLNGATRVITTESYSVEMLLRIIKDHKVTITFTSCALLLDILKCNLESVTQLRSIKAMIITGWKVPLYVVDEMNSYLPNGCVVNSYGSTEISVATLTDYPKCKGKDTVGRLMNGYTIKIIDENGNRCGIDMDGEICIKSPYKFIGYYGNKVLTAEVIDSEGFLRTGDIGHMDENGYLYIVDRKKDMIAYNIKIFPSEIESFLLACPDIGNVCVVGVLHGPVIEMPTALVVRAKNSKITEQAICDMVAENLQDHFKLRGGVFFVDSLPTNNNGKILRQEARKTAAKLFNEKCLNENGKP